MPVNLEEGVVAEINLFIGDDLQKAKADIDVENIKLIVRILQVCPEDKLSFSFNGNQLDITETISKSIYGGSVSYTAKRGGLPSRITSYDLFELDIDVNDVIQGYNSSLTMLGGGNSGGGIQNDTTQQNNIEDSSQVSDMDDEIPF